MSAGSLPCERAMAACTSCEAASMLRLRLNCKVICVPPCVLMELMDSRPAMVENSRSSSGGHGGGHGLGARARQGGAHLDGGIIDVGQIADRQLTVGNDAKNQNGQHRERRHDGPADKEFGQVHKNSGQWLVASG